MEKIIFVRANPCRISPLLTAPFATAFKIAGSLTGNEQTSETDAGAYSYLFRAHSRYGLY